MDFYAIILSEADEDLWANLSQKWGKRFFPLSEVLGVYAADEIIMVEEVRDIVGLNSQNERHGLVIEFDYDNIEGFEDGKFWEWLRKKALQ